MKRRAASVCGVVLASCLCLAGCAGPSEGEEHSQFAVQTGVSDDEVVLGTHTDLSGPIAIWGVGIVNGMHMRIDEANDAGGVHGRQIRLVVEDTGYQVPRAIQAANKLIHRDKIFAMLLALGTPTNNAVIEEQFAAGVPNLFPGTGARSTAKPYHRLKFTARGIYYDEMRAAVKYFHEQIGATKFCTMYHDTEYGLEILEAVEDQVSEMRLEIAAQSAYLPTDTEFTAAVLKLKNAGCEVVLMGSVHRDTILILEAARKMGWADVAWIGNNAACGQVIADQESGSGEGYYCFVHMTRLYEDSIEDERLRGWWNDYLARFGEEPGLPAMEGYRNTDLVIEALERVGPDLTRDRFIAAMESIQGYEDIFGYSVTFSEDDHNGVQSFVLTVVENGRFKTLDHEVVIRD